MEIQQLLNKLDNVRTSGEGFTACCPVHDSKSRSTLALKEAEDGRILMHCFGGCNVAQVCEALDIELSDLMPPGQKSGKVGWLPMDLLPALLRELNYVMIVVNDIIHGDLPTDDDLERLRVVRDRFNTAINLIRGQNAKRRRIFRQ